MNIIKQILSTIVFEKEYSDESAIRRLDEFSHIWLIWGFSENIREEHSLTVRPPILGGNERVGARSGGADAEDDAARFSESWGNWLYCD